MHHGRSDLRARLQSRYAVLTNYRQARPSQVGTGSPQKSRARNWIHSVGGPRLGTARRGLCSSVHIRREASVSFRPKACRQGPFAERFPLRVIRKRARGQLPRAPCRARRTDRRRSSCSLPPSGPDTDRKPLRHVADSDLLPDHASRATTSWPATITDPLGGGPSIRTATAWWWSLPAPSGPNQSENLALGDVQIDCGPPPSISRRTCE